MDALIAYLQNLGTSLTQKRWENGMDFDINTLRGLATVFCMMAFFAGTWAYSDKEMTLTKQPTCPLQTIISPMPAARRR